MTGVEDQYMKKRRLELEENQRETDARMKK